MTQDEDFKKWWFNEGSQPPYTHHDCEEHTMRMCEIAWANGAYKERDRIANEAKDIIKRVEARGAVKEREACAEICDARATEYDGFTEEQNASEKLAAAIRSRGQA